MSVSDLKAEAPDGYIRQIPYTWGYFKYQNPVYMNYVARLNGFTPPSLDGAFTYCDLGCGNGVTVNLLASTFPKAQFYGVDLNPDHIRNSAEYASKSGLKNTTFLETTFDALRSENAPKCDFITLHGVLSWVNADIRQQILDLVNVMLKPNGVLYTSYNTLPGWSELIPLWKLFQSYFLQAEGDAFERGRFALESLSDLRKNGARYFANCPAACAYLDGLISRDSSYLLHDFGAPG